MVGRKKIRENETNSVSINCRWKDCNFDCRNDGQLNTHLKDHLDSCEGDDFGGSCPWSNCDFVTDNQNEWYRHIYYHGYYAGLLRNGKFECETNDKLPKCAAACREGDKIPELLNDFACEWIDCMLKFSSIIDFQDHVVQHANFEYEVSKAHNKKPKTQCRWNFCKKRFDNKYRLIEHIRTHSNRKEFACYNCGDLFRTRTTLYDHLRRQPENNTQQHQCSQCFKCFATVKLLRSHMLKHVYRVKCTMCDMTCYSSASLAVHFRYRHLNDRPIKCSKCDYRCVRKSDLIKHRHYIHDKDMYQCTMSECNYTVRASNMLRRHFYEVHGNLPFIYLCDCCDKAFKNGPALSAHLIKIHDYQLPSGHKRFTYRIDENGFYRVQTQRIESLDVTKQILAPSPYEVTQDRSCYEIVSLTHQQEERIFVSNDPNESQLVGAVVISLPDLERSP